MARTMLKFRAHVTSLLTARRERMNLAGKILSGISLRFRLRNIETERHVERVSRSRLISRRD